MPTKRQIAVLAGIVLGIPTLFWLSRPHYEIAGYGLIAGTIVFAVWMIRRHPPGLADVPVTAMRTPDATIRAEYGYPPRLDDFFGEVTPAETEGWNYQLWLEEWAELYLGSEEFASLEMRFADTAGVDKVAHMDREVFLIKTNQLTPQQVRAAFWLHFLNAAKGGNPRAA